MASFHGHFTESKTTEFMLNLNKFGYIFGLPNFWVHDVDFPWNLTGIIKKLSKFGNMAVSVLLLSEYMSFFTQKNLSEQQYFDLLLFTISHTIVIGFRVRIDRQRGQIRDVMFKLGIGLKDMYNDRDVEERMIKRSKFFSMALILNCSFSVISYALDAILKLVRQGVTFTTIITAWPYVEDQSVLANICRALFFISWLIYVTRVFSVYTLVICLTIGASHQFMNVRSYFYNLNNIFTDENLTQKEKEQEFEDGLKLGIKLHCETIQCTGQIQATCADVFSGQIIFSLTLLIVSLCQLVNSPRSLMNVMTIVATAFTILLSTGFFMWNAGDITVEADSLSTAIFSSGWENCWHESSVRVRKLVVIAMMQAQQPVILTGLRIIPLSYQSYVSIVKSSYSVFSVVY